MNKQIDKLVIATDAWCDQNLPSNWTDDVDKYLPVWNEKFAEFIVNECIRVLNKDIHLAIGYDDEQTYYDVTLLEHFEVDYLELSDEQSDS